MIKREKLKRWTPTGIFIGSYTLLFLVWRYTFLYTLPFLLGLITAAAIQPAVDLTEKKLGWRRGPVSGLLTVLALALLIFGTGALLVLALRELTEFLMEAAQGGFPEFTPPVREFLRRIGGFLSELGPGLLDNDAQELRDLIKNSSEMLFAALQGILSVLGSLPLLLSLLLVTACTSFFVTRDYGRLTSTVSELLGPEAVRSIRKTLKGSTGTGRRYLLSYALIYFISFCEAYVILYLLGIPYPLTISAVTCIADVLPVLGPGIVFTPVAIYQLLIGEYGRGIGVMIGWLVMTCIRQVVEPRLVASTIKLHPLAMLTAVYCSLAAGSLWVLIYMLGLFTIYGLLKKAEILPPIFETRDGSDDGNAPGEPG